MTDERRSAASSAPSIPPPAPSASCSTTRLPAAGRPGGGAHPGAEGRRGPHVRRRHRGRGRLRGRELRVRHPSHRRARHHAGRQGAHRAQVARHAGRPRGVGLARPRRARRARRGRRTRQGALRRRDGAARCPWASAATSSRCTSISTSSTDARAGTCRSAASAGSPRRPRSRCSSSACSPRVSTPASSGRGRRQPARAGLQRQGRGPAVARPAQPAVRRRGRRGVGRARRRAHAVPQRVLLGAAEAPVRRRASLPDTGGRHEGVEVFTWTPREFIDDDLLQFLLTDANDQRNQIPFIRERVQAQLKRFAVDVAGRPGAVVLRDPRDAAAGLVARPAGQRRRRASASSPTCQSLVDALGEFLEPEDGAEPDFAWSGRVMGGTGQRVHAPAARGCLAHRAPWCAPASPGASTAARASVTRRRDPVPARAGAAVRGGRAAQRDLRREGSHRSAAAAVGDRARRAQQVRAARGALAR